jgi:hypothetical protein
MDETMTGLGLLALMTAALAPIAASRRVAREVGR